MYKSRENLGKSIMILLKHYYFVAEMTRPAKCYIFPVTI